MRTSSFATMRSKYFKKFTEIYGRYIDDSIGLNSLNREKMDSFLSFVQYFYPALEFSSTISNSSIVFPDISVNIHYCALITFNHIKNTLTHTPNLTSSSHRTNIELPSPNLSSSVYSDPSVTTMSLRLTVNSWLATSFCMDNPHYYLHCPSPGTICEPYLCSFSLLPTSSCMYLISAYLQPLYAIHIIHHSPRLPMIRFRLLHLTHLS